VHDKELWSKNASKEKLHALYVLIFSVCRMDEISVVEQSHLASLQSNGYVKGTELPSFKQELLSSFQMNPHLQVLIL